MLPQRREWPATAEGLADVQDRLAVAAGAALAADEWLPSDAPVLAGCFVVHPRGTRGRGRAGDPVWAAAVAWRPAGGGEPSPRGSDRHLRRRPAAGVPARRADDVLSQAVVVDTAPAPYVPGLLALRDGPVLTAALAGLVVRPELVLLDATGLDHQRGAGLAVHLGAMAAVPTVGITRRPLVAAGPQPGRRRGAVSPLWLAGRCVAYWVCTRTGARPLVAHAGWRTSPETAARVALLASTPAARTPVPLQEARRVAREARGGSSVRG